MKEENSQVILLPHNEEGYKELKECLKDNQMVALNRATGTGKSFIVLKYLAEHKDKKILYLSPSYPIIDQLLEVHMKELGLDYKDFKNLDTEIYSNLLGLDMEELAQKYDIIILDEYHRCGAREWGRQIKKLLDYIRKYKPKTKVIGTTATEIRYLDNKRNMNNILFDGVCASKLPLADALLKGILPAPIYINIIADFLEELDHIEQRVLKKAFYPENIEYYLDLINKTRFKINEIIAQQEVINLYLPKIGKYLGFCTTKKSIEDGKKLVRKILKKQPKEYIVHSGISKDKNKEILNEFRNYKGDEDSVLYSINILNEGVHVKDIDAIFMMRPTTSPIIFFQQLGRLLSYSKRKDNVVVVDTVNNLKRSPYIYRLYTEVTERAKELIKTDPANKERYEKILDNFKIVDLSSKICEELDKIKDLTSNENLKIGRLEASINILSGKTKTNNIEKLQAHIEIFKHKKYITLEQFKRISELDIEKPEIFLLSYDEFKEFLDGNKNIHEKNNKSIIEISKQLKTFYHNNYYLPSIFSDNEEERNLAQAVLKNFIKVHAIIEPFLDRIEDDTLSLYEKIIYEQEKKVNVEQLYEELNEIFTMNIPISTRVIRILQKEKTIASSAYINKINIHNMQLFKKFEIEEKEEKVKENNKIDISDKVLLTENFEIISKKCMEELSQNDDTEKYLIELAEEIKKYIKEKHVMPKYYRSENNKEENAYERILFYKKIIFQTQLEELGLLEDIENIYEKEQLAQIRAQKEEVLTRVMTFIEEHDGDFPSIKIDDPSEKDLAMRFSKIKSRLTEEDCEFMNVYLDKYNGRHSEVINRYINFIKRNKRYPMTTSNDEYELKLITDFTRNEQFLTSEEKTEINAAYTTINKRQVMRNSYKELLKIRQENKKREG